MNKIDIASQWINPNQGLQIGCKPIKKQDHDNFKNTLKNEIKSQSLIISAHAQKRLESRNIKLSEDDLVRLNNAVNKAQEKGIKDSLILMDDKAFIISVKNKTMVTAVDNDQLKENVFTNIDGALFI
jgi:flagellar operon protein